MLINPDSPLQQARNSVYSPSIRLDSAIDIDAVNAQPYTIPEDPEHLNYQMEI